MKKKITFLLLFLILFIIAAAISAGSLLFCLQGAVGQPLAVQQDILSAWAFQKADLFAILAMLKDNGYSSLLGKILLNSRYVLFSALLISVSALAVYGFLLHQKNQSQKRLQSELNTMKQGIFCWLNKTPPDMANELYNELVQREEQELDEALKKQRRQIELHENIMHEIKNELAVLILKMEDHGGLEEMIKPVEKTADLATLSLRLAHLDDSSMKMKVSRFDLIAVLETILYELQPLSKKGNTAVHLEAENPVWIEADEFWVGHAVSNILKNCLEILPENSVIQIYTCYQAEGVKLIIEDNGPGVKTPDELFKRFKSEKPDGFGLGLALAKRIMELHYGDLILANRIPNGSQFTLFFPVLSLKQKSDHAEIEKNSGK